MNLSIENRPSPKLNFGLVKHTRLYPVRNHFSYGVFTLKIPMRQRRNDPKLLSRQGLGDGERAIYSFYDEDHGQGETDSLAWIEKLLKSQGINDIDGEIWLQTFPRVFGYVFNPVSFWICLRHDQSVRAILAEVNNTFGERHCYLLSKKNGDSLSSGETILSNKIFHVSPFCSTQGEYQFRFLFSKDSKSGVDSVCRIELHEDNKPLIYTSISGHDFELSRQALRKAFFSYPLMTFGVILRIHWQALKLWSKGVRFHPKPNPPKMEVT